MDMVTNVNRVGFIGSGNMAAALIKGIIKSRLYSPDRIRVSDNDQAKLDNIKTIYGVEGTTSNCELVKQCNIIVLSVKPQAMDAVLSDIKDAAGSGHMVISIAAGIKISTIQAALGDSVPVIRVMPNTPALIRKGVSAAAPGSNVSEDQMNIAVNILGAVGTVFRIKEEMMDEVTALSGSGPGFVFRIMECFVEAAVKQGFDPDTATMMIIQTFLGSSMLAENSDLSLADLRKMVTSPGGTTQAGLNYLDTNRIGEIIDGTVETAKLRSIELGKK